MRKNFESAFSRSSHCNLRRVSSCIVLQEQNTSSQFSSPLSCNFLAQAPQFCCIICTIYSATLLKLINHDYSLTEVITFPAEEALLNFLGRVIQGASTACFAFSTNLGLQSVDKITGIIFISRQEILRNIEPTSFLVISQHSRYPSCRDLGHTQDIRKNCLHCPKTYVHFAGYTSQVWSPVTHSQVVHDLYIFISGDIFGAA